MTDRSGDLDNFIINVMNDKGQFWKYAVQKDVSGFFHVRNMNTDGRVFNKDEIHQILYNSMRID